ncbi:unnamed protein product [Arabis nemorensis]|uniref:Uncharacterized protein n=1 Tax=Arabis nemorensis TaxID=586526 RepID=A0A565B9K4_9BRAS|nr:unnamed protein product [Arabis nemorensis]
MSLICWDQFLLSCSLDNTVKIWAAIEGGNLEVTYTHKEEHGVLALCGVHDAEANALAMTIPCASTICHHLRRGAKSLQSKRYGRSK